MSLPQPEAPPVLSTPDTHIFDLTVPQAESLELSRLDDEQINVFYEIQRTVDEIRQGRWKRIALQFPDHMLVDAPRIFKALSHGLKMARKSTSVLRSDVAAAPPDIHAAEELALDHNKTPVNSNEDEEEEKLFILADTSYGACCVDEVAAEHAAADAVVHYGRSCLSPTARLPVIYVFTNPPLDLKKVVQAFKSTYLDLHGKTILMADIPFSRHLLELATLLKDEGYTNLFVTSVIHDTTSPLPNRSVPTEVEQDIAQLQSYQLFHISAPPPSLLLILSSRVGAVNIFSTQANDDASNGEVLLANSSAALRRRYALLTRISNVPIIGILINTLSVRSYLEMLSHIKSVIASAGKKSYTFVVGKVNAAKIANFSEVGGWVVIGCWESSLFDSADFWKPVITPWELEVALRADEERLWTGAWRTDYEGLLANSNNSTHDNLNKLESGVDSDSQQNNIGIEPETESEEESEPPEFDLRTGRYVSHTRPMALRQSATKSKPDDTEGQQSLIPRPKGDLATIGGQVSPAADFFRNQRSWQGLGSDFAVESDQDGALKSQDAAVVEQGRSGIARGYVIGGDISKGERR